MRTIFAEYNPGRNSIDVYTSADYMLRIDCWEAEKNLRTTPESDCALNTLDIIVMFKKSSLCNAQELSDCRQSGARTVVLAPFFSVCSNCSPKMIKKSILSSLSYRFFEASLLVFLDSCRQR